MPTDNDVILDAALEQVVLVGLRGTTVRDIAQRAGLDRTTVYRRMGSKEQIVGAVVLREFGRLSEQIRAETVSISGASAQMSESFARIVLALRNHPLLQQVLRADAGEILPQLTTEGGATILNVATDFVVGLIGESRGERSAPPPSQDRDMAAVAVRMAHSLVLVPDAEPVMTTLEQLRDFASTVVWRDL